MRISESSNLQQLTNYKNILITGAAGFIGHALCKKLLEGGYTVFGLDNINDYYTVDLKYARLADIGISRSEAEKWNTSVSSSLYENFHFMRMDVENREELPKLFKEHKFDAVIHLAAQAGVRYSIENPEAYIDSNIVGFLNILECCRHNKIQHLVYASSSSVYGANDKIPFEEHDKVDYPVSLYAATKKSNELMAHTYSHLYQLPTSGLRFFTVYGPWGRPDMAPMLFASAITEGRPIKVFNNGNMQRDFTYIDDIVQGIIITLNNPPSRFASERESERASERKKDSETVKHTDSPLTAHESRVTNHEFRPYYQLFNIGNGSPVHLLEFIETMEATLEQKAEKKMMGMQAGDVPRTWADTSQLNALGYESTTDIGKGVKSFIKWFKEYKGGES